MDVTKPTHRNNIQPMLACVTEMVMIFLCRPKALRACECLWFRQIAIANCPVNCLTHRIVKRMFLSITSNIFHCLLSPFFCLVIFYFCFSKAYFTFCRLVIFAKAFHSKSPAFRGMISLYKTSIFAQPAIVSVAILTVFPVPKFLNRFRPIAFNTGFRYGGFRHGCFSNKQLCLEPATVPSVIGSPHYDTNKGAVK